MGDKQPLVRVAAIQAAPVFLNREATIAKAAGLMSQAAGNGAQLVVFPESFVPCYPVWLWAGRADVEAEGREGDDHCHRSDTDQDNVAHQRQ